MILRRNPAGRRHVARLAVVSLIGLSLVGLSGAANADKPGDLLTNPSSGSNSDICLPKTPDNIPVHLHACLKQHPADPSAGTPSTSGPSESPVQEPTHHRSGHHHHAGPFCVPVPADLAKKLPAELRDQLPNQLPGQVPTCIPKCLSDSVMHLLKKLPQDTLDELIADITSALGETPACLMSLLPSSPPPSQNPPSHHRHRHHRHLPPINTHIPSNAGPAAPVGGSPDFTG